MENTSLHRKISMLGIFCLLFQIFAPWSNLAFAIGTSFQKNLIQANVPAVSETKASLELTVNVVPTDGETITIGTSTITFVDIPGVDDNQLNTSGGTGYIDLTYEPGDIPRSPHEIAAMLRSLTYVFDVGHGELSMSGSANTAIFTTAGAESSPTPISFTDGTSGKIIVSSSTTGVLPASPVAQIVDFRPVLPQDHLIYRAKIDGTAYSYSTSSSTTEKEIVEALQASMDTHGSVTCTEDDTKITCTADTAGVGFTYDTEIVDKTSLYNELNAEFADGATRTIYKLTEASYTPASWSAYVQSITDGFALETNGGATDTMISDAIALIQTRRGELAIPFSNTYDITANSTADSSIDAVSYSGKTYVTYGRDGNIYFKEGIGSEELVGVGTSPAIAVSSNGTIGILYTNGGLKYKKKSSGTWGSEVDVVGTIASYDIDMDSSGNAHVVYDDGGTGGRGHVVYVVENGVGTWSTPIIELTGWYDSGSGNYYHNPRIKIDTNGKYHIAYEQDNWGGRASWSDKGVVITSNAVGGSASQGGYDWNTGVSWSNNSLVLDSSNNAHFIYSYAGTLYHVTVSGDSWSSTSLGLGIGNPSISTDGVSIGLAYNTGVDEVIYKQDDGAGFIGSTLINTTSYYPTVVMSNGEVYVYYVKNDGTDDEVKLASTTSIYTVPGQIDNVTNSFVSTVSGSIGLSGLEVGGVYMLMSGSTMVSAGVLVATGTTGSLTLNPSNFMNYGGYTLTLSGSYNGVTTSNIASKTLYIGPFDYQDLYVNQVAPTLLAGGIATNLGDVTYANVQSFSGLYFEKTGMGKIFFSNTLDLTNSGTITFLQNLPSKLSITDGNINFNPIGSDFSNYGAQLFMYFDTGSTFVSGINDPNNFVVRSSTGLVLSSSGILSNVHGACGVGDPYCTIFFDTAHFTTFDLKPVLTEISLRSNNAHSGALAKNGDRLILEFTASEALTGSSIGFDNPSVESVEDLGGNRYRAASVPLDLTGPIMPNVEFGIWPRDMNGNVGNQYTATTDGSAVNYDITSPTAEVLYNPIGTGATAGDVIATLSNASENIVVTNNSGSVVYTFTDNGSFTFEYRDLSGNTGTTTASVAHINKSLPTVTLNGSGTMTLEQNTSYTELGATWSDGTDGTGTVSILSGSIDTSILGTQQVEYLYINSLGLTGSAIRTVNVVDTTPPGAPTITTSPTMTSGSSLPNLTGSGDAGVSIYLYKNGTPVCGANTVNESGSFVIVNFSSCLSLIEGDNTFTAYARDPSGNTSGTGNTITIIRDSIAPNILYTEIRDITNTQVNLEFAYTEAHFRGQDSEIELYNGATLISTGGVNEYNGNVGYTTFSGLTPNTTYTFILHLTDDAGNTVTETGSFTTTEAFFRGEVPADIYQTGGVLFGDVDGWVSSGNTFGLGGNNLFISSDPSDSDSASGTLTLSGVDIVVSSGSWNGILLPPNMLDDDNPLAATGSEIGTGVTVVQTVQAGAEDASLMATGGYFSVSFVVSGYPVGTTFSIYRSEDGNSWVLNTPDNTCTLDAGMICAFRTDHLSFFAPVIDTTPDVFSFSSVTSAELNTSYTSNTITVSGIATGTTISIVGGSYQIGSGSFVSSAGVVQDGQTVKVRATSSSSYSSTVNAVLTIGGVSATYSITTKAASSGGNGGGGISIDYCPNGDTSGSSYDNKCTSPGQGDSNSGNAGGTGSSGTGKVFKDIANSFARVYIESLSASGIVSGYSNGTFHPNTPITRADWIVWVMRAYKVPLSTGTGTTFKDIPKGSAWIIPYINTAKEMGIISGQTINGKLLFRPNASITRAEALKILFLVAKESLSSDKKLTFSDSDFATWMFPYVIRANELGIVSGQTINGKLLFRPNASITRAEAAKILYNFLKLQR